MRKQLLSLLILVALFLTSVPASYAQGMVTPPEPPAPPQVCDPAASPCQTEDGL